MRRYLIAALFLAGFASLAIGGPRSPYMGVQGTGATSPTVVTMDGGTALVVKTANATTTTYQDTASFNAVDGKLLVVSCGIGGGGAEGTVTITDSRDGGTGWVEKTGARWASGNLSGGGYQGIWVKPWTTNASITVRCTRTGTNADDFLIVVYSLTGAASSQTGVATALLNAASDDSVYPTVAITPNYTGSLIFFNLFLPNGVTLTANASSVVGTQYSGVNTDAIFYSATTTTANTQVTMGATNGASIFTLGSAVEIRP